MRKPPLITLDLSSGILSGKGVVNSQKKIGDLKGVFHDEKARKEMDQETPVYSVQTHMPVSDGTPGGLFFGNSTIFPGRVADEFFMTRGHFHANMDTGEYYWCISGTGILLCMDTDRRIWTETMKPGNLHYIPGKVAHRVVNTGEVALVFNACWPSDAGHNYHYIKKHGFRARLFAKGDTFELKKYE
jgi:glucose-6-phosphate isomerase